MWGKPVTVMWQGFARGVCCASPHLAKPEKPSPIMLSFSKFWFLVWGFLVLLLCMGSVHADPGYYLVTVYEDEGKARVDYRYWTVKIKGSPEVVWPELGLGYGVSKRWYTELYTSYIGANVAESRPSTLNWQNDFLLTQGQFDVDVALHTNWVLDQSGANAHTFEFGPVLQTDVGRVQLNGNLVFEQALGGNLSRPAQLKYQWQAKYRWNLAVHTGIQGFGELGPWNRWEDSAGQSHRWGPVVSGSVGLQGRQSVEYYLAMLKGKVNAKDADMLSLRLQYLF